MTYFLMEGVCRFVAHAGKLLFFYWTGKPSQIWYCKETFATKSVRIHISFFFYFVVHFLVENTMHFEPNIDFTFCYYILPQDMFVTSKIFNIHDISHVGHKNYNSVIGSCPNVYCNQKDILVILSIIKVRVGHSNHYVFHIQKPTNHLTLYAPQHGFG